MKLNVVSWNIRHMRQEKIDSHVASIWEVCQWAHVVFIYEDHSNVAEKLAKALNAYEQKWTKPAANWKGGGFWVTDEYVCAIWRDGVTLKENGGVSATIGRMLSGERCPAVLDITLGGKTVTIGAWHAYGPAKVSAKDLFQSLVQLENCDVLIGDFNFQSHNAKLATGGLQTDDDAFTIEGAMDWQTGASSIAPPVPSLSRRSSRIDEAHIMREIAPCNHTGSTTYTDEAIGKRKTGLDRCLVTKSRVASCQLGVLKPAWYDESWSLTDHMPLQLIVDLG